MPLLTCEFDTDGSVREWHATPDGVEKRESSGYRPALFVAGPDPVRARIERTLTADPKVADTSTERWLLGLGDREQSPVLRVACERVDEVRTVAGEIRGSYEREHSPPGTLEFYNVDLAPQFRYCVETDTAPVPARELDILELSLPEPALVEDDVTALTADGESLGERPRDVLSELAGLLERRDPDVLLCSTATVIPLCHRRADELGLDGFRLGRAPGYEQLAEESTYESYGQVGHSPARYRVPGRAVIDRNNSFLLTEAGVPGLLDLVERSWRPLQETAWGSIGTILTAVQVREALGRGVLVPWNKWEPERFKSVETLHTADRGGFTFAPDVGLHENVVELDFGSLYPNIMREYNISPETVCCDCCSGDDVPGLGYSICDRDGFIPDVLGPVIDDRAEVKDELRGTVDATRADSLQARAAALKWVLVSCFGYQGYRNAKFGRIECHEAVNAYAREILLDAKETLERNGWRVVHGIVDSLWVQPVTGDDRTPLAAVAETVSTAASIPLEVEDRFEWVCFVPRRDGAAGALTKYFGAVADRAEYKLRGVEARQRSTPQFVESLQRELLRVVDRERSPAAVADRVARALSRLRNGGVDPADLVVTKRASKERAAYQRRTHTVAALERAADLGLSRRPGQDVSYVVVDGDRRDATAVRLAHESPSDYDAAFYRESVMRAAESVVAPLGWDRAALSRDLAGVHTPSLSTFGSTD